MKSRDDFGYSSRYSIKSFSGFTTAAFVHRRRHDGSFDESCGLSPETQYVALSVTNRMIPGDEYHLVSDLSKLPPEALIEDMSASWGHSRILTEQDKKSPEYQKALKSAETTLAAIKAAAADGPNARLKGYTPIQVNRMLRGRL